MSRSESDVFPQDGPALRLVAWNVSSRYAAILVDTTLGLVMLPFNIAHLGQAVPVKARVVTAAHR